MRQARPNRREDRPATDLMSDRIRSRLILSESCAPRPPAHRPANLRRHPAGGGAATGQCKGYMAGRLRAKGCSHGSRLWKRRRCMHEVGPSPRSPGIWGSTAVEYARLRLADDPHLWASTLFDELTELTALGYGAPPATSRRPRDSVRQRVGHAPRIR